MIEAIRNALAARGWFIATTDGANWVESSDWGPVVAAAIIASDPTPHPGKPHEFITVCKTCREFGILHVSLITRNEVVKIEDR